jgi:hypothetical protein
VAAATIDSWVVYKILVGSLASGGNMWHGATLGSRVAGDEEADCGSDV